MILPLLFLGIGAVELDFKLLKESDGVELVKPLHSQPYFLYYQNKGDEIQTPLDPYLYTMTPKITFFDHKNSAMCIVPLANKDHYLNASFFDTIRIEGKCNNCVVAISDKKLFLREDNVKIGDFKNIIPVDKLMDKIDFRSLKYLIFFAPTKEDINIKEITFLHTPKEPSVEKPSVWIWKSSDVDIKKLKANAIKRVYLQVDKDFQATASLLYDNSIEVVALDGNPSYIFDDRQLMQNIQEVIKINSTKKIIEGFQIDIEPHTLRDFDLHKAEYLQKLLDLSHTLYTQLQKNGLKFSIVIPFWYDSVYVENKSVAYTLIDSSDEVVLMSYRTDSLDVLKISADKLAYAQARDKKIKIGIELMPIEDEYHYLFDKKEIAKCKTIATFWESCKSKPYSQFEIKGNSISFFEQKEKLPSLLHTHFPYASFTGFVYHHIDGL